MNRQQFASVTAAAYVDQFSTAGHRVMNERIIVWNGDTFTSQSSLTPVEEYETVVMALENGCFGDVDADDPATEAAIVEFLNDPAADDIWNDVQATIEGGNES